MERWKRHHHRGSDPVAIPPVVVNSYHPSFSSSLLDAIDRSIDKGGAFGGRREGRAPVDAALSGCPARARLHCTAREPPDVKQHGAYGRAADDRCSRRRAVELQQPQQQHFGRAQQQRFFGNSTSSSSESSYGGFSSSEAESAVPHVPPLPRPVRTSVPAERKPKPEQGASMEDGKQKAKGSIRSRFRASKFYGEFKKGSSTPVSPGARLASFLNTLFSTAGHPKKAKISTSANPAANNRGGDDSACSSASSYSRSCLSKTPSSRGQAASSAGSSAKRSVRFCPVSVIVDEDCRPCGQKHLYEGEHPGLPRRGGLPAPEPPLTGTRLLRGEDPALPAYLAAMAEVEERQRAREAARGLVGAYKEKKRGLERFDMDEDDDDEEEDDDDDEEEDDDDDAASCSSSDLFELKNLAAIGCGGEVRYRDELPVYETTRLDANRAIARGLIV